MKKKLKTPCKLAHWDLRDMQAHRKKLGLQHLGSKSPLSQPRSTKEVWNCQDSDRNFLEASYILPSSRRPSCQDQRQTTCCKLLRWPSPSPCPRSRSRCHLRQCSQGFRILLDSQGLRLLLSDKWAPHSTPISCQGQLCSTRGPLARCQGSWVDQSRMLPN